MTLRYISGCSDAALVSMIDAARDAAPVSGLTHNFYRYPARFSPQFVRATIDAFSEPGDLILDPFMGGGTTIVEALALGRKAIGTDISSLAAFISQVKTNLYDESDLEILQRWAHRAPSFIHMHRKGSSDEKYADTDYYRHMSSRSTWRFRKAIEQGLKSAKKLENPRLELFARCAILRTAQWALDGRKKLPTLARFRGTLSKHTLEMIEGARQLRLASAAARVGHKPFVHCLNRSTKGLEDEPLLAKTQKPKLVVTSPLIRVWLLDTFVETAKPRIGEERTLTVKRALDDAFAASFSERKPALTRDQDATPYTVPFNKTIQAFNRHLCERLVQISELNH